MSTSTYLVNGMTCGHCVAAVSEEIRSLPGVRDVTVDLVAGGDSRVVVDSAQPLPDDKVRAAVDEAGYRLVDGAT
jgi:copper chaperone